MKNYPPVIIQTTEGVNHMDRYVDGFVIPILKANIEKYREIASQAGDIWKSHGAIEYYECVGDDLVVQDMLSFTDLAKISEDETVIFSWIVYESKAHRDEVNAAVMQDPRMLSMMQEGDSPFDYHKMAYGGFKTLVVR
jgi:uncharacterized protein YbaA (DUF1428 family)